MAPTPWPFVLSPAITIAIAVAVLAQTLRTAAARPADLLRYDRAVLARVIQRPSI